MATASTETQSHELGIPTARLSTRRGLVEESRRALVGLALMVGDWITLCVALFVVWGIRVAIVPLFFPSLPSLYELSFYFRGLYFFAPWLVAIAAARLYVRHTDFWDEVRAVVRASTWGTLMAVVLSFGEHPEQSVSRILIATLWLVSLPALTLSRHGLKLVLASAGLWRRRILVVGVGDAAAAIVRGLHAEVALGYDPVGFVVDLEASPDGALEGLPVLGSYYDLPSLLETLDVRDVIVAIPEVGREELTRVVGLCEGRVDSVRVVPDTVGFAVTEVDTETIGGHLLISMRSNLARPTNLIVKRFSDLLGATLLLAPAVPVLAVVALLIRMDSRGPAFFVQQRVGRHGRLFPCYKFRTMFLDADSRLEAHLAANTCAREEWLQYKKLKAHDPRVTRMGRYLRRLSFDELPQLLNVLRGEMSLVGPRPYIEHELAGHEDAFRTILLARPGITGLWQVSGRNRLTLVQRLRLDEYYVRNWSLWLDLQIALRTFGALARSDGAY